MIFRQQMNIIVIQIIAVNGNKVFAQQPAAVRVGNRRSSATIGHLTARGGKPFVEWPASLAKHFVFLRRFCQVHRHRQIRGGTRFEQIRLGRIGRVG